jgi:hypothetical protein
VRLLLLTRRGCVSTVLLSWRSTRGPCRASWPGAVNSQVMHRVLPAADKLRGNAWIGLVLMLDRHPRSPDHSPAVAGL